jgi:Xaa-Pro dipeptidase
MIDRITQLINALKDQHLDAVVLNPGPSLNHLTGLDFHLMERPVVAIFWQSGKAQIILPELERAKVAELPFEVAVACFGDVASTWPAVFAEALAHRNNQALRIGVEPTRIRFLEMNLLQSALPQASFVDGSAAISSSRLRKDATEIAKMKRAAEIAQMALLETLKSVRPGQSEKQIAAELMVQLYRAGSDPELPFSPIVSTGPNTANPHASPTDRVLQEGDFLLIDWGAGFEHYFSDITRTFSCGEPSDEMRKIADLVLQANTAARLGGKAGMSCGDIDKLARDVIVEGGYGERFIHRTGHGLGMEAHEAPWIVGGNATVLEEGMVFTIEPGIYLEDFAGVRIEDDVVVGTDGLFSLSDLPREVLPLEGFW